jgi:hypothetical protein
MVHGDVDSWRKGCESYGFMLAKSMIIMNAEIHKDRMRPENIYSDIGKDNWEYANDRYIGTGRGWNYNVMNAQLHQPRVRSVGRFGDEDESLMRATGASQARLTTASFGETQGSLLTEANVIGYNDFANVEVLLKEYSLGKGLLENSIENIDDRCIENLRNHKNATEHDIKCANVFFRMLAMLNKTKGEDQVSWESLASKFDAGLKDQISAVPQQIEERKFDKDAVDKMREEFRIKGDEDNIKNMKEFLCEAFCLIEIVQEIHELRQKAGQPQETHMVILNSIKLFRISQEHRNKQFLKVMTHKLGIRIFSVSELLRKIEQIWNIQIVLERVFILCSLLKILVTHQ